MEKCFFRALSWGCEVVKVQMTSILVETGSIFRFRCFMVLKEFFLFCFWAFFIFNLEEHLQFGGRAGLHFKSGRTSSPWKKQVVFWLKIMSICTGTSWSFYNTLKSHHRLGAHLFCRLDVVWHASSIFLSVFHTFSGVFYSGIWKESLMSGSCQCWEEYLVKFLL